MTEAPSANAAPPARSNLVARLPVHLIAAVIAFALCAHAYALHKRVVIDWWTWALEFILSAAFLVIALREPGDTSESAVRRWTRRLFGIASVALLFTAIHYGGRFGRELSSGIFTAAALIAFLIFRWVPISKADALCLNGDDAKAARSNIIAWIVSLAGVALAAAATALNYSDHLTGLCLWLAGLVVLAIGAWRAGGAKIVSPTGWQLESGPLLTHGAEALAVTLTLLLGIALRVPFLHRVPAYINSDEGRLHRYALSLYKDGFPDFFALGWNAFPNISVLVDVVPIQILGMGIGKLRLASAIFGVASLLVTYFWARRWWGNVVALLAMLMLAFNQEHINWSRVGMNNIQQVLVGVAMLATFASALQRRRPLDWLLFGYACGFTFLTYHAAKLFPALLFAVFVVYAIGIRGFLRRNFGGGVIALIGFLVVLGPHLVTIYVDWFNFYHNTSNRVDLPVLFDAYRARNFIGVRNYVTSHVLATLYLFTLHELPFLDRFLFIAALPGVGWMFWRWRDPRHTTVLAWIGGILLIGGMITAYPPNVPRLIGVLPVACIIPAVVAGRVRGLLYRTLPAARADLIIVPALVLWLSLATHSNLQTEFVLRTWMQGNDQMTHVCRILGATPLPATAYTVGGLGEVDTGIAPIDCMMPLDVDRTSVGLTDDPSLFPIRPSNKGTAVFVFTKAQFELLELARHYYPDARYEALLNRDGMPHLWTATMTPEVIEKHRGMRLTWARGQYPEESERGLEAIQCPGCLSFPVEAVGTGLVYIASPGQHAFRAPHTKIQINGRSVDSSTDVYLPAGWHALRAQAQLQRLGHSVVLEWRTPDNAEWHPIERPFLNTHPARHGLLGRYFTHSLPIAEPQPSLAKPDYEQITTALAFDANPERDEKPPAGFASKGATMEWIGTVEFPEGNTQSLRLDTTSPTKVFLNGVEVLDNHGGAPNSPTEATLTGLKGPAKILVRTVREAEPKVWYWWLRLSWKQPGGDWATFVDYKPPAK